MYIWVFLHFVGGFGVGGGVKWEWIDSAVHELVWLYFYLGKSKMTSMIFFRQNCLFTYLFPIIVWIIWLN